MSNLPASLQGAMALAPRSSVLAGGAGVDPNAIMGGIGPSFGILTYRGKVFRVKYRGEELALMMDPPSPGMPSPGPKPWCDVVIVSASPAISKIYYEGAFQEGDTDAPDCFSTNGVAPDPASPKKQAELCATCPKNIWGSRANNVTGAKGKACQDSKRLAVVPADDMRNDALGGPMLLRVPPASLQNMGNYNTYLQNQGHTFFSVKTRLQFDPEAAYPKLVFVPTAALGDGESTTVLELQRDARVIRMLQEAVDQVRDAGVGGLPGTPAGVAGTAPPAGAPAPAVYVAPVAQPAVQTAPPVVAAPVVAVVAAPVTPPGQPVVQPAAQPDDGLAVPRFLQGRPGAAPMGTPAVPVAPVAPVAPPAIVFRELTPVEMGQLAATDMPAFQKYMADLAVYQASKPPKKPRGKAAQAAPSPAVTEPVVAAPASPAVPTAPIAAPAMPPAVPAVAMGSPTPDAALAHLDAALLKAL